jgi:hypothetical protein
MKMGMCKGFKLVGKKFASELLARNAVGLYFEGQECYVRYHSENVENKYIIYMILPPKKAKKSQVWKDLPTIHGLYWGTIANNFSTVKI